MKNYPNTDCHSRIQAYHTKHPKARAIDIARATGCTEAEALSFLSDQVWRFSKADLSQILAEIRGWPRVMVLVRNQDGVAEVEVPGELGTLNGDWLNWIDEGYNLHIRQAATHQILALVRPGKRGPTYSFNLVNKAGQVFCRFYAQTGPAQQRFLSFVETAQDKGA
jgi:putative heme degradation protein